MKEIVQTTQHAPTDHLGIVGNHGTPTAPIDDTVLDSRGSRTVQDEDGHIQFLLLRLDLSLYQKAACKVQGTSSTTYLHA